MQTLTEFNKNILFSIILPTYNVAKYIDRSIRSCLAQSYSNLEIIVVDDCGSDDSLEKAKQWAKQDDRVRIFHNSSNLGTYHARKNGVLASSGDYVLFLDPDDELNACALERICQVIQGGEPDLVLFDFDLRPARISRRRDLPQPASNNDELLINIFLKAKNYNCGTAGKVYARSVLLNAYQLLDIGEECRILCGEDALLFLLAASQSNSLVSINEKLYIYHKVNESITVRNDNKSVVFKSQQILLVVSYIYLFLSSQDNMSRYLEYAGRKLVQSLLLDRARVRRHIKDENGKSLYFSCAIEMLRQRPSLRHVIRPVLYLSSFGFIKL